MQCLLLVLEVQVAMLLFEVDLVPPVRVVM
jgi:hypothetical protein